MPLYSEWQIQSVCSAIWVCQNYKTSVVRAWDVYIIHDAVHPRSGRFVRRMSTHTHTYTHTHTDTENIHTWAHKHMYMYRETLTISKRIEIVGVGRVDKTIIEPIGAGWFGSDALWTPKNDAPAAVRRLTCHAHPLYVCMYVSMYTMNATHALFICSIYVCMHACICMCICVWYTQSRMQHPHSLHVCMYMRMYVCVYACIYVCMHMLYTCILHMCVCV